MFILIQTFICSIVQKFEMEENIIKCQYRFEKGDKIIIQINQIKDTISNDDIIIKNDKLTDSNKDVFKANFYIPNEVDDHKTLNFNEGKLEFEALIEGDYVVSFVKFNNNPLSVEISISRNTF